MRTAFKARVFQLDVLTNGLLSLGCAARGHAAAKN